MALLAHFWQEYKLVELLRRLNWQCVLKIYKLRIVSLSQVFEGGGGSLSLRPARFTEKIHDNQDYTEKFCLGKQKQNKKVCF